MRDYANIRILTNMRRPVQQVGETSPRNSPLKASIRRYYNEGHDVVFAKDMHIALKERPVKGTTASVCIVQEQHTTLEITEISN